MKTIAEEVARAEKQGAVKKSSFSGAVRNTELMNLNDGDIITFPETYDVLEQKIRGSEQTAEYIFVEVDRKGQKKNVQFYPSTFWKSREVCDDQGMPTGEYKRASGEVADFVQDFTDIDQAIKAIAKKGRVQVKLETIKCLRFGAEPGSKPQNATIPTLTWAA